MAYLFARPADLFQFSDVDATVACLESYGIPAYPKLLKEIEEGEALLSLEFVAGYDGLRIVRYIRPLSMRITHDTISDSGLKVRQILREYEMKEGRHVLRKSSLSGKMKFYPIEETVEEAFLREREQELGIPPGPLLPEEFMDAVHPVVDRRNQLAKMPIDVDIHESDKFPGLLTHSTLVRKNSNMRDEHYRPEGYVDPETGNIFRWANEGDNIMD